ncbi:MAG: hypothetical protein Q7S34_02495 [bacterium]|nr:hypothetical protein [bacterium]
MSRVVIPVVNWVVALADAVRNADDQTVIVVNTEEKKELALRAANRFGKTVIVEVETNILPQSGPYTIEELVRPVGRSECPRCYKSVGGEVPCPNCGGH